MEEEFSVTRNNYKDRLFCMIFGDPAHKENLLSLFNALNETDYDNVDNLEVNTIGDAVFMGMKNDVSCIVEGYMPLFEHQSTINPNMPLRGFFYHEALYSKMFAGKEHLLTGRKLVKIPTPRFFVLYNGTENAPEMQKLKLSDAFMMPGENGEFEWTATFVNINPGHNDRIVKACKTLNDYQSFVAKVREFMYDGLGRDEAAAKSIDYCIKNDILRDFLSKHRAEVKKMILSVYDEEKVMNLLKEQYREEYLEEGLEKGREEGVSKANDLFASVINYVKEGKSKEELLKMGFPETTVDLVLSARS